MSQMTVRLRAVSVYIFLLALIPFSIGLVSALIDLVFVIKLDDSFNELVSNFLFNALLVLSSAGIMALALYLHLGKSQKNTSQYQ